MTHVFRFLWETYTGIDPVKEHKSKLLLQHALHEPEHDEHMQDLSSLFELYQTDPVTGIRATAGTTTSKDTHSRANVKRNKRKYGRNALSTLGGGKPFFRRYMSELTTGLLMPMWLCALIFLISYGVNDDLEHLYTSLFVAIAIVINGTVTFMSRDRADEIIDMYEGVEDQYYTVRRGGFDMKLLPREMVVGDLILNIKHGMQIPADCLILECTDDCYVDNSQIVENDTQLSHRGNKTTSNHALSTENMIFRSTHVAVGEVLRAMVVRVGDKTQMGRMRLIAGLTKKPLPPIMIELANCETNMVRLCLCLGIVGTIAAVIVGFSGISAFVIAAGFALASLPVALKCGSVICGHMSLERLVNLGIHLKDVMTLENLGSTSCVVTDRAGFISTNTMHVACVAAFDQSGALHEYATGSAHSEYEDTYSEASRSSGLEALHRATVLSLSPATRFVDQTHEFASTRFNQDGSVRAFSEGQYDEDTGRVYKKVNWTTTGEDAEGALFCFYHDQQAAGFRKEEDIPEVQDAYPLLYRLPFRSQTGFELQVRCNYRGELSTNNKSRMVFMKGMPEWVLPRCTAVRLDANGVHDMSQTMRDEITDLVHKMGDDGLHVIAVAESKELKYRQYGKNYVYQAREDLTSATFPVGYQPSTSSRTQMVKDLREAGPHAVEGLVFLGLIGLYDPVRQDVLDSIQTCHDASVRMIMCTGAHPSFATSVVREAGIFPLDVETDYEISRNNEHVEALIEKGLDDPEERIQHIAQEITRQPEIIRHENLHLVRNPSTAHAAVIICDDELFNHDDAWWDEKLTQYNHLVVARCQYNHKELVIRQAKRSGHVVLCTGNKPRDVPSLKTANVGVAMGALASQAARETADIISLDQAFHVIVDGIREGRLTNENLKKMLTFCLVTNVPQITAFLVFILLECPLPLTATMILLIDVGMNLIPTIGMGIETAEDNLMERPPRNVFLDKLISKNLFVFAFLQLGVIQAMAGLYAYVIVMNDFGYPPHLLPTLGQNNNWGNYPLYCKYVGGQYVNEKGEIDPNRNPQRHPPSWEYPLWDDGDQGYIEDCTFAVKNFWGNKHFPSSSYTAGKFKIGTAASYTHSTVERTMATVEVIEALHSNNYFEYTPWKARMSPFWRTEWLYYDVLGQAEADSDNQIPLKADEDIGSDVTLEEHDITRYFSKMSLGLWSICLEDPTFHETAGVVWKESDTQKEAVAGWNASHTTVTQCRGGPDAMIRNDGRSLRFSKALFCNGDRSYDRIADGTLEFTSYSSSELTHAAEKAEKCALLDDHIKQVRYCQDRCSLDCTLIDATDRANSTTWTGKNGKYGHDVKQCANIGSRMAQRETLRSAHSAFTVAVILCQVCAAMVLRTRWHSLGQHGMENYLSNFGVHSALLFLMLVVYSYFGNFFGGTRPLRFTHWLPGVPWALLLFGLEELRKMTMRVTSSRDPYTRKRVVGWAESVSYF